MISISFNSVYFQSNPFGEHFILTRQGGARKKRVGHRLRNQYSRRHVFMKSNMANMVLTVLLAISLLLSVVFCLQFMFRVREYRSISGQINIINAERARVQQLAAECVQYSEKNQAINPLLEAVGLKPKTAPAGTKPGAK